MTPQHFAWDPGTWRWRDVNPTQVKLTALTLGTDLARRLSIEYPEAPPVNTQLRREFCEALAYEPDRHLEGLILDAEARNYPDPIAGAALKYAVDLSILHWLPFPPVPSQEGSR